MVIWCLCIETLKPTPKSLCFGAIVTKVAQKNSNQNKKVWNEITVKSLI